MTLAPGCADAQQEGHPGASFTHILLARRDTRSVPDTSQNRNHRNRQWRRVDLHLHTPASADWLEPGVGYLEWLQKAEARGLDIVAITDHNTVAGVRQLREEIEDLTKLERLQRLRAEERKRLDEYRRLGDRVLVLPGFEFTATLGFHILGIFPPETTVRELEFLLLKLNVPAYKLDEGSTEVGPTTDVLTAYRLIDEAGGLVIAAHANSSHGVALHGLSFGGQTKIAYTQDPHLHALEVTDLESRSPRATARFYNGSKPEYPRRMHCIQGSDAHRINRDPKDKDRLGIGDRVTEVLLDEVDFASLRAVFLGNDFARTRPYRPTKAPFDYVRAARDQGPSIVQSFHESMTREGGRLHKVLCDIVAFANTNGGTIFIGALPGTRLPPTGVEKPEEAVQILKTEIRKITPPLDVAIDVQESEGRSVILVRVPEGRDKPYALDGSHIYVRAETETSLAVRDEIVRLVRQTFVREAAAAPSLPAAPEAVPLPVSAPAPAAEPLALEATAAPAKAAEPPLAVEPPRVGVEILNAVERKGTMYYTVKDLRNGTIVHNVTKGSARKLWSYAIQQWEKNDLDETRVRWIGPIGLWQVSRRAGKMRYDFVQRDAEGKLHVYYGVTEEGIEGEWRRFLSPGPEAESAEPMPAATVLEVKPSAPASVTEPALGASPTAEDAAPVHLDLEEEATSASPAPTTVTEAATGEGGAPATPPKPRRSRRRQATPTEGSDITLAAEEKPPSGASAAPEPEEGEAEQRPKRRSRTRRKAAAERSLERGDVSSTGRV